MKVIDDINGDWKNVVDCSEANRSQWVILNKILDESD